MDWYMNIKLPSSYSEILSRQALNSSYFQNFTWVIGLEWPPKLCINLILLGFSKDQTFSEVSRLFINTNSKEC